MGKNKLSELYLACRKKILPLLGVKPNLYFQIFQKCYSGNDVFICEIFFFPCLDFICELNLKLH